MVTNNVFRPRGFKISKGSALVKVKKLITAKKHFCCFHVYICRLDIMCRERAVYRLCIENQPATLVPINTSFNLLLPYQG